MNRLFNEAEVFEDQSAVQEEESVPVAAYERKRRSGSVKDVLPENVPADVVEHRLSEQERICEACGTHDAGDRQGRTLQNIPAQVRIREDWYYRYKGYHALPKNIRRVGCWAHARRYFDEALKVLPATQRNSSQVHRGWTYCNQLFAIEDKLKKYVRKND